MEVPSRMKAAQYHQSDNAIHVNEIDVPSPQPNDLLIKVLCSSLCRSDLMNFEPDDLGLKPTDPNSPPLTIGHEAAGVIVGLGSSCQGFQVGQEVGFLPARNACYECAECQVHQLWCQTNGGCNMPGHKSDGFFQEYIVVDYRNAIVLPQGMSAVDAAPLFCAGVTSYHGIADLGIPSGQWVAIIGCGGLGHLGIQYAKAKGYKVIGLDISDDQLGEAKKCGADHVFNTMTNKDYATEIKRLTDGGCHAVVNYTSSKASYDRAPDVLRINGILMVVGHPQQPLTFTSIDIALHKFRIYGASNSIPSNLKEFLDFSVEHDIKSHTTFYRSLDDIHEMIANMQNGKVQGRVAVRFD